MGWIVLAAIMLIATVVLTVFRNKHESTISIFRARALKDNMDTDEIERRVASEEFPIPSWTRSTLLALMIIFSVMGLFNQVFFYAEPGFVYHVRTITGQERVIDGVGYKVRSYERPSNWEMFKYWFWEVGKSSVFVLCCYWKIKEENNESQHIEMKNIMFYCKRHGIHTNVKLFICTKLKLTNINY